MNTRILLIMILVSFFFTAADAQWTSAQGPYGGVVRKIMVSGQNLFAGLDSSGVFMSTLSGASWTTLNTGLTNHNVWTLAFDGSNLYAGTNGGGAYVSTNNGGNWTAVNNGITGTLFIHSLATSGSYVLAAAPFGAFRTSDGGTTWTKITTGLTNSDVMTFAVSESNLFAGTLGGVFASTNNGTNWSPAKAGLTTNIVFALTAAAGNLYAATSPSGLFLSTNNGTSWTSTANNLGTKVVHCLASSGSTVFAGNDSGVYISTNNGGNWVHVNDGLPANAQVHSLTVTSSYLLAGTDSAGVWKRPLTELVTGVALTAPAVPEQFGLDQNYPNPFNPTTTIRYAIGRVVALSGSEGPATRVRLAVYDMLGREVAVLVDEQKEPGAHIATWDASGMASGIYICRLTATDYTQSRTMVLLK
jgi:hypothetical protein